MPIMHVPYDVVKLGDVHRIVSYPSTIISRPIEEVVVQIVPYWNTVHAYIPKHDPEMILKSKVYHKRGFNEAQKGIYNYTKRYKWIHYTDTAYEAVVCADIDNDGIIEVLASIRESMRIYYPVRTACLNGTNGSIRWSIDHGTYNITTHDINNDGYYEIILCEDVCSVLRVLDYNGNTMFTISEYGVCDYTPPVVYDVDNDGNPEIVYQGYGRLVCVRNDGSILWVINDMSNFYDPIYIASADIDNDGYVEIVVAGNSKLLIINGNNGSIKAIGEYNYPKTDWYYGTGVALIDINNDSKLEILVGVVAFYKYNYGYIECGGFYAFDCNGNLIWFYDTFSGISGRGICVTDTLVVSQTEDDTITACYVTNGNLAWRLYDMYWVYPRRAYVSADIDGDDRYEIVGQRYYYIYDVLIFIKDDGSIIYEIWHQYIVYQRCLYDVDKDGNLEIIYPTAYSVLCLY